LQSVKNWLVPDLNQAGSNTEVALMHLPLCCKYTQSSVVL